jgi:hypothetical protein
MARSFLRSAASIALAATLMGTAATSSAQGDHVSDEDRASARILAAEGQQMAANGDCAGALDRLSRAESIVHAAATEMQLAQCEIQLGKVIAGTEFLIRIVNEPLPSNPPPGAADMKKRAQAALDAAQPRIAKLRIHVERASTDVAGLEVTVDAQPVPAVLLDGELPVDPGAHHVTARQAGFTPVDADVSVADGETRPLVMRLDPLPLSGSPTPPGGVAAGEATGTPPPVEASAANGSRSRTAFVLYTAAGAGLFLGAAFGVAAFVTKSNLDAECAGNLCPASAQSDIGALHTDAILSTVGFGVALAGAVAGTIVLVRSGNAHAAASTAIAVHPWLGPGSMGLVGTFR